MYMWIGRYAQTGSVAELDGITEFHSKASIPFHAIPGLSDTTCKSIPIHVTKWNIPESFQIHKFNSNALQYMQL